MTGGQGAGPGGQRERAGGWRLHGRRGWAGGGCLCSWGAGQPPGHRVVLEGARSQVRRSLIPLGLSTAWIHRWDLWQSGPGCRQPGNIAITTTSAARHPLPRLGSRGHCRVPSHTRCPTEASAYPGGERVPEGPWAAAGSAWGDMEMALRQDTGYGMGRRAARALASPSSRTAVHPGVLPPSMAVHPGDSTGKWGQLGPKVTRGGTHCPPP